MYDGLKKTSRTYICIMSQIIVEAICLPCQSTKKLRMVALKKTVRNIFNLFAIIPKLKSYKSVQIGEFCTNEGCL